MDIKCPLCGGKMRRAKAYSRGALNSLSGNLWIISGAILTLTCVGAIVGIPLIIVGSLMAGKQSNVWQCDACKHQMARG